MNQEHNLIGPIMMDLVGTQLRAEEAERLNDPRVGGLILFSRNYQSPAQLSDLVTAIREAAGSRLLIAVDHEGGRVQRFREGFTAIPPMRSLGKLYDRSPGQALSAAQVLGGVIATELAALDLDFSFTPVLDLDLVSASAIGDRAFHHQPEVVTALASSLIQGLNNAGMAAVGKHFPGHGNVVVDSHVDLPIDERDLDSIRGTDLQPFAKMCKVNLQGVMPAHIVFSQVDDQPAGFSKIWIQDILRGELGFQGAVFSDDLSMQGAASAGTAVDRARLAVEAGCDMLLFCNEPEAISLVLDSDTISISHESSVRLRRLQRVRNQKTENFCETALQGITEVLDQLA